MSGSTDLVYFAVLDPTTQQVTDVGCVASADAAAKLAEANTVQITEATAQAIQSGGRWQMVNGVPQAAVQPAASVDDLRNAALANVDAMAEGARLLWITGGAGQAAEYEATWQDAVAAAAAPDPLDPAQFPWLTAEVDALADAGQTVSLRDIVTQVQQLRTAWTAAGSQIKRLRRSAKLRLAAAQTADEISAIMAGLNWPRPPV
jgi:hypothetical protein